MMGILNKLFGYRWSLYIVQDGNQLCYAMHENSVMGMIGYVMTYYSDGRKPLEPWSLHLNFNHKHHSITLKPEHFENNGDRVSSLLIKEIEAIDKGWKVPHKEPVFEEAATKKRLNISSRPKGRMDINAMFEQAKAELNGKPKEVTFFSVMNEVFGKT